MNNSEVHEAITNRDPLFEWMHLTNGEQYLIPFICQRCGTCCRKVYEAPCIHFIEPNICSIYEDRPSGCRSFPVNSSFGTAGINCEGARLLYETKKILRRGMGHICGYDEDDVFVPSRRLARAIDKLRKASLPDELINRFVELNT